jgi:hypothetical protein
MIEPIEFPFNILVAGLGGSGSSPARRLQGGTF